MKTDFSMSRRALLKTGIGSIALPSLLASFVPVSGAQLEKMQGADGMEPRFIVVVESDNLHAEIWVNNIPVGTVTPSESGSVTLPVNEYILEGENRVGIMLHAGPNPSTSAQPWNSAPEAKTYHGPAEVTLTFARYAPEEVPMRDHPPALARIDWKGEAVPVPAYEERKATLPKLFDPPPWVLASRLGPLDTALRAEAVAYLQTLYSLLATKQFETYLDLSRLRLEAMTKAYGMPYASMQQSMRESMQTASKPPLHLQPFAPETVDLRLAADGRLIDVNRVGGGHVFLYEAKAGDDKRAAAETMFFPVKIGKKDGKWLMLA